MAIGEAMKPLDIEIRSSVHTGEVEFKGDDIGGIAVHVAARVAALATGGQVLISSTVRDLVAGSNLSFRDFGTRAIKGLSEDVRLFAIANGGRP